MNSQWTLFSVKTPVNGSILKKSKKKVKKFRKEENLLIQTMRYQQYLDNRISTNLDIFDVVTFDTPRVDVQMISVYRVG